MLFGEVQALRLGDPKEAALLYFARDYHAVGSNLIAK